VVVGRETVVGTELPPVVLPPPPVVVPLPLPWPKPG